MRSIRTRRGAGAALLAAAALGGALCSAAPCGGQATPPPPVAPTPATPKAVRYLVVLDAAHGGADTGARLGGNLLEKDVALAIAARLRSLLSARGFIVIETRSADTAPTPTPDQRAEMANHADALACVLVHATATGNGVHLFTSSLAPTAARRGGFLPWESAQSASIDRSLRLAAEMRSAFDRAKIPVTLGSTYLRPLDNLTCPAIAFEMAPLAASDGQDAAEVADPAYQQRVADAVAWALMEWRMHTVGGPQPEAAAAPIQGGGAQ